VTGPVHGNLGHLDAKMDLSQKCSDNRILHYDQYCMLMLLYLFNPIVTLLGLSTLVESRCRRHRDADLLRDRQKNRAVRSL